MIDGTTALEVITHGERWEGLEILHKASPEVLNHPFQGMLPFVAYFSLVDHF
jgi:hypothetical protein